MSTQTHTSIASTVYGQQSLLCWRCSAPIVTLGTASSTETVEHICPQCDAVTECRDGIWRCLSPDQVQLYDRFVAEYEYIRAAEGRGSSNPEYYLELPFRDTTGHNKEQWKIRARTFRYLEKHILTPRAAHKARPLRILDLGAGNGWLSYRLSLLGHSPVAVDLLTNNRDGLGAATNYRDHIPAFFPRVQASLENLPFPYSTFDLIIYNASFHYSQDYSRTLDEALHCLRPDGAIVIADTPWYAHERSGQQMIEEKHARFQSTYGFPSDSISSQEFLTPDRLRNLERSLHIKFKTLQPFYGLNWALRPLRARLQGRRVPSQFRIFVTQAVV